MTRAPDTTRAAQFVEDWVPPRLRRSRRKAPPAARQVTPPAEAAVLTDPALAQDDQVDWAPDDPRWQALTERTLAELDQAEDIYRPTNFWGPGLDQLLADMSEQGLAAFKRWPTAAYWFLPTYGNGYTEPMIRQLFPRAKMVNPDARRGWLTNMINGSFQARRDLDVARLAWDQTRWKADLEGLGESPVGEPVQHFSLVPDSDVRHGRGYLNYLLCLAALSRHIEKPPTNVLEIGGGFGVLGEIILSRDPDARYVNLDIPPLVTVSSYYLTELFGHDRVLSYDDRVASEGPIDVPGSAVLPNWRIRDLQGPFDLFVNSFSFQEMEPAVVAHYVDEVCNLGVEYVVSLNSLKGKPKVADGHEIGVIDPVTSGRVIEQFEARGYALLARHTRPWILGQGEIAVLRRG
jgi:putative sugar O-methyltransferase